MKVAILGYGKMGQIIEKIAKKRGHNVILKINQNNLDLLNINNLKKADVVIDFSTPKSARTNIKQSIDAKTPIVSGTTGFGFNTGIGFIMFGLVAISNYLH